jgi:LysM repeat protein
MAETTYVVKKGDSLSKIAGELLGDANRWPEIFEANKDKIEDPNLIYPGQEFVIPAGGAKKGKPAAPKKEAARGYVPGESKKKEGDRGYVPGGKTKKKDGDRGYVPGGKAKKKK